MKKLPTPIGIELINIFPKIAQLKQRALSECRFWQQGKHKLTEQSEGICEGQIFPLDKIKRAARLSLSRVCATLRPKLQNNVKNMKLTKIFKKLTKKTILAILAIIVIDAPAASAWPAPYRTVLGFDENWLYRIATPIAASKMQSDCGDLRFTNQRGTINK